MTSRIDDLVIGTKRRMRGFGARIDGLAGVFRTLAEDHAEIIALAGRISRDAGKREELWPELKHALLAHERAELRVVYPVLRELADTREYADQHEVEATKVEDAIDLIEATYIGSDLWGDRLLALVDLFDEHAREEEVEIFPHTQLLIGVARAKALDRDYEREHARLLAA